MHLEFTKFVSNQRVYKAFLESWVLETLKLMSKEKDLLNRSRLKCQELSLVFVSQKKIKELNDQYRSVSKETDVLSFDGDGVFSLGELVFCLDVVKLKAQKSKLPIKLYLSMLTVHGLLHLLGYDHELSSVDEQKMFALQDKLMRKVASKLAPGYKNDFDIS